MAASTISRPRGPAVGVQRSLLAAVRESAGVKPFGKGVPPAAGPGPCLLL